MPPTAAAIVTALATSDNSLRQRWTGPLVRASGRTDPRQEGPIGHGPGGSRRRSEIWLRSAMYQDTITMAVIA
jgi:hypothetical protein